MKIVFLSHNPHPVHSEFAKTIGAEEQIIPFNSIVSFCKKFPFFSLLYPVIGIAYGTLIHTKAEAILIDGGSSIWTGIGVKLIKPNIKLIYLDGDLFIRRMENCNKIIKKIKQTALKKFSGIISVSDANAEAAKKNFSGKVLTCPPYVNKITPVTIKRENCAIYLGRLDPDKNVLRDISFSIMCPLIEKLIIAGDGVQKEKIKKIASKNKKIEYIGLQNNIAQLFSKYKFLIHLPDIDPHPLTPLEAAMCGCFPIISKGVGSRYLFDSMFVVNNPNNFEEINKKIEYILNNQDKAEESLKKTVNNMPSKETSLKIFKDCFYSLLKK